MDEKALTSDSNSHIFESIIAVLGYYPLKTSEKWIKAFSHKEIHCSANYDRRN